MNDHKVSIKPKWFNTTIKIIYKRRDFFMMVSILSYRGRFYIYPPDLSNVNDFELNDDGIYYE